MSDFAYAYFNSELEKLDIPSLEEIFEKVQALLAKKRAIQSESEINQAEVDRINAVYDKIAQNEDDYAELEKTVVQSSMRTMWESLKDDIW